MKFLIVDSYYPAFLESVYRTHIGLSGLPYDRQHRVMMNEEFGTADFYSANLISLGHEASEVVANCKPLQRSWARQKGLRFPGTWLPWRRHRWIYETLAAQIRILRPDVLYIQDMHLIPSSFLRAMRSEVRFIVGQNGTRPPQGDFSFYDLIVSSLPNVVEWFRRAGCRAEFLALGFEPSILKILGDVGPPTYDLTHIGAYSPVHRGRNEILEAICRAGLEIECWGYDTHGLAPDSPIRARLRGAAWGLEMYRVRALSKIVVTRHVEAVAGRHANLCSLYEATGVGAMLLVDERDDLDTLFEPEVEVITYSGADDCIEKIRYYLAHEDERLKVARAGQRRTLHDHTWRRRMQRLLSLIHGVERNRTCSDSRYAESAHGC